MRRNNSVQIMVMTGLLCAVGIVIPMFSPIKIILEPASFTLASHVAIFLAMFISPTVAVGVSLGTTIGFFMGGFPIVVVMRALSHVVFALVGAMILRKKNSLSDSITKSLPFSLLIGLIHASCEVLIVLPFYFGGAMTTANYQKGFFVSIFLLVGVGTVIHSMVDFGISIVLWQPLKKMVTLPTKSPVESRA